MHKLFLITWLYLMNTAYAQPQEHRLREFTIGITQEFENFNPLIMSMLATTYMYRMINRTLVVLDEETQWVPQLVYEIPTLENGLAEKKKNEKGEDYIEATWIIREKAKWGDGVPVTCHDLKLTWEIAQSPFVSIGERETYEQISDIVFTEDKPKHCRFIHRDAKWNFNRIPTLYAIPNHLERAIFERHGNEAQGYEQNSLYTREPTHPGLYHGPYRISEIKLGSHVSLEKNPSFFGKPAFFDRIIVKLIPNTGTLEANLRSGTINMVSSLGMSFDQALAFNEKVGKEKLPFDVNFQPSLVYEHIDFNLDHPVLKDVIVRRALLMAIDRQALTQGLFEGKQTVALHHIAPLDPWYTDDPEKIVITPYARRQAARLLEQAGWKKGADGIRVKDGLRLEFTLMTTAGNRVRELVQVYLQDQWRSLGVDVQIKNEPARVFFGETTRKRKFDGMAMYAWISSPERNPRSTLSSQSIPSEENGWSGQNQPGWKNDRVDELITLLDLEFDPAKRLELIHEMTWHYTNELPVLPLYYRSDVSITPKNLRGYKLPGHQFPASNHIEHWHLE
jgi:peptide/nickel transport system substrate-binding protein